MGDQGSNKTGSARDDELKHEMQGELNASRALRPEEAFEPVPSRDAGPVTDWSPPGPGGGVPPGMTPRDVDVRSELARHLEPSSFPANRGGLLQALGRHQAGDGLVDLVRRLPDHEKYRNVQDVMRSLGYGVEAHRV